MSDRPGEPQRMMGPAAAVLTIWIVLGLVLIVAEGGSRATGPDWGQGVIFAAPFIALITVVVTAAILLVATLLGPLDADLRDVWNVIVISVVLAPIGALVLAFAVGTVLPSFPLLVQHLGDGILVWLGLWWPVTIGAGLPLGLMQVLALSATHVAERDPVGRAGPAGSDAVAVAAGATVGAALAQPDADPTFIRLLARPLSAAVGAPGSRRPLAIRIPLVTAAALLLVPVFWVWGLAALASRGLGRSSAVSMPIIDHAQDRSSPGVNSMVQLLALVVPTARDLVLRRRAPPARQAPALEPDELDRTTESTLELYRRELGIGDRTVLGLLALTAAYALASIVSTVIGYVMGVRVTVAGSVQAGLEVAAGAVAFGLVTPIASFVAWVVVAVLADRAGRRAGDHALTTVAIAVPVGLALLLARLGG